MYAGSLNVELTEFCIAEYNTAMGTGSVLHRFNTNAMDFYMFTGIATRIESFEAYFASIYVLFNLKDKKIYFNFYKHDV